MFCLCLGAYNNDIADKWGTKMDVSLVKRRELLKGLVEEWNANRLDLFEISQPDEVRADLWNIVVSVVILCKQIHIVMNNSDDATDDAMVI